MAVFKCKMCGGALEIGNMTVATCAYCGTQQTLPRLDDARRAELYDRANHYRRNNEFDKASALFEQLLNEGATDAEAYWSLVLCRYGVEYVEDPATHRHIPTVNRAQYTSVFDDENYRRALQLADPHQQYLYQQEAHAINEIQRGILDISSRETPFDVFICYKETDDHGRRTTDSLLAQELYGHLTREGLKVFFSRITLEDKLGSAYEPYIFAALNSAKVMVVLGTRPGHLNAPWVKNEWSRYLALIRSGSQKTLIPAYRDMDPYRLPEEFSHLQAQDLAKVGCMQDLVYGIKKIVGIRAQAPTQNPRGNTAALLKRAALFLNDGDWRNANAYCEKVLDMDPECADAYLYKLLADLKVHDLAQLNTYLGDLSANANYMKILMFADPSIKSQLFAYEQIGKYNMAADLMAGRSYESAFHLFSSLGNFRDSQARAQACIQWMEAIRHQEAQARLYAQKKEAAELEYSAYKLQHLSRIFSYIILALLYLPFLLTDLAKDGGFLFILSIVLLVPTAIAYIPITVVYKVKAKKVAGYTSADMVAYRFLMILLPAAYLFFRFLDHETRYVSYFGDMQAVFCLVAVPLVLGFCLLADLKDTISSKRVLIGSCMYLFQLFTIGAKVHTTAILSLAAGAVLLVILYFLQDKWEALSLPRKQLQRALCGLLAPLALFVFFAFRNAAKTKAIEEALADTTYMTNSDHYFAGYRFEDYDGRLYSTSIYSDGDEYGPYETYIHCSYLSGRKVYVNGQRIIFNDDNEIVGMKDAYSQWIGGAYHTAYYERIETDRKS